MKKIYNSPAMEMVEVYLSSILCLSNDNAQGDPQYDPFNPAPGRKPF